MSYVTAKCHALEQEPLWLNLDETSVSYSPDCCQGCVVAKSHWCNMHPAGPHRRVRPDRRRGAFTYVALIASNPAVQAVLPHFLISSSARMPKKLFKAYHALPKTRLQLLRAKSSWATSETMILIFKALKEAVAPWVPSHKPILLLDVAGAHLPKEVLRAARTNNIQLIFVPASATALVQRRPEA